MKYNGKVRPLKPSDYSNFLKPCTKNYFYVTGVGLW